MPRHPEGPKLFLKRRESGRSFWYIRWTPPGSGRSREYATGVEGGPRPDQALADFIAETVIPATTPRRSGPSEPDEFRIDDALADYGREHIADKASSKTAGYHIATLGQWWRESSADDITEEACKRYAAERVVRLPRRKDDPDDAPPRTRPVSAGTVRRELATLLAALHHAVRKKRLTRAPHVWMPPPPVGKDRWLPRTEAAALLRAARREPQARRHLPRFILLALYTGARKGAVLDLQWTQVDFLAGTIKLNPPGRAQTKKKRPVVPMTDKLRAHLRRWHRKSNSPYVVARLGEGVESIKNSFASACETAGLDGVTPHTLRHTCGTWLAQAGVDLWKIAGWLGHSLARTTELYAHHHPAHMQEAKRALDRRRA